MVEAHGKADGAERKAAGYKSWKKKYRKMRIVFDQKMHECEELHKQEAKAAATVKRLAIENDRLLDLLLEVNNSPQIPPDRRIELSLKPSDSKALSLPIDRDYATRKESAMKRLDQMLNDVPHSTYTSAKEAKSPFFSDLVPPEGEPHPANFLSADDIDDYIYLVDTDLSADARPTLAPLAHPNAHQPSNPNLKNPTSVTNWLRKYAPKIFLQDGEHGPDEDHEHPVKESVKESTATTNSARKSRANPKAERSAAKPSSKSKRSSTAARASLAAEKGDWDVSMDDDPEFGSTPAPRTKRKRGDDDGGYKPRGSSTRPSKKKRKSDVEATPTVRKSKKEVSTRDD